ncbi:MAG: HAMP domain-containing histidine kinase [Clostridiales bacterium]|jgi:signal transduction histidine kinase|nr:HAMP domain-containing histidine kinase [Clostridiales bacterium]
MILALRKKFILINMALVFAVLLITFTILCVSVYNQARAQSYMALTMALDKRGDNYSSFKVGQRPPEGFVFSPLFVVRADIHKPVLLFSEGISIDGAMLAKVTLTALERDRQEGLLADYNLRFMKRLDHGMLKIAFVEISAESAALGRILAISALAMLAALSAFLIISLFLSRLALRPAEQAWQQQRRFVADASHELKTPLTVILANMDILKKNRAEPDLWRWIENTEAEATRMKELVDNLLFLAKSDAEAGFPPGKREPARKPPDGPFPSDGPVPSVNLSDVVLNVALSFESVAFERGISISTNLSPDVYVTGDEPQLRRLAAILLDNAVKYSDRRSDGVVTVTLTAGRNTAALSVHSGSVPIAREDLEHLFERFYRADKARANDGYGLGLAIAKSITEQHQGKISAESSAESGTVFTVVLPHFPSARG